MTTTEIHGASVSYRTLESGKYGVVEVEYSGVLGDVAVPHLWAHLALRTVDAPALVLRVHRALTVYRSFPQVPVWIGRVCPGAIICREDQYGTFSAFSKALVPRGVVRGVFLQSHEALAIEWAEEEAHSEFLRSGRPLPHMPECDLLRL